MAQVLTYSPGQIATLFLETKNADGYYTDGYYLDGYTVDGYEGPTVHQIILPDFTTDGYFPYPMNKFATGIYQYRYTIPSGAAAVGSYFVILAYREPDTKLLKYYSYQIQVNAPFGLYSVTSS